MLNPITKKVLITRDVKWLKSRHSSGQSDDVDNDVSINYIDLSDDSNPPIVQNLPNVTEENQGHYKQSTQIDDDETEANEPSKIRKNILRELKSLKSFNTPGRLEYEGGDNHLYFFVPDRSDEIDDTPATFQQAWHHPSPEKREKWRDAIRLEFKQMIRNGVWRKKGLDTLPSNRKGIGTKWIFKVKKNGVYRARLVAKGYNQIAGIDFQYNFIPVTSEVTLRI